MSRTQALAGPGTRGWRWVCLLLIIWLPLAWAADEEAIVARAWFEDRTGGLSFDEVQRQAFTPYAHLLSLGYGQAPVWLRLRIDPGAISRNPDDLAGDRLILRIRPTYLDSIELFDPLQPRSARRLVGDRHPWSDDEYHGPTLNFVIPRGDAPRDVWLRLLSTSTRQIHVEAVTLNVALDRDARLQLFCWLYLAAGFVFWLWALIHWLTTREGLIGLFVLRQTLVLAYAFAILGALRIFFPELLPATWVDTLTSLLVITVTAASALFDFLLLRQFRPNRTLLAVLAASLLVIPASLGLMAAGWRMQALQLNMLFVLGAPLLSLLLALSVPAHPTNPGTASATATFVPRWLLIGVYALITLGLALSALPALGWWMGIEFSLYGFVVHGFLSSLLIILMLQTRAYRMQQHQAQLAAQLRETERTMQQERAHRQDQEKFLSMLTHELKTPLAVISMQVGLPRQDERVRARIEQAVADMDMIIERCALAGRLDDHRLTVAPQPCRLPEILDDLLGRRAGTPPFTLHPHPVPPMDTDPQLLKVILGNLLENAEKYGAPSAAIDIEFLEQARDGQPGIEVRVSNLPGPAGRPDADEVFSKYYRAPQAHRQSGSGLGLHLASGLARLLHGQLDYQPTATHIRFVLWLPV